MSNIKPWQQRTYPDLAFIQAMLSVSPVQMHAMVEEAKELRDRVAELEAAAKLALDALVATTPVPREYDEPYYRREWPKEFAALDALRNAGVK